MLKRCSLSQPSLDAQTASKWPLIDAQTAKTVCVSVCVSVTVNRLKSEHNVEIHIPSDADTTAVRIEGSREGVARAKAELMELVDKMVSSSSSSSHAN